jgi:hypothetical protein
MEQQRELVVLSSSPISQAARCNRSKLDGLNNKFLCFVYSTIIYYVVVGTWLDDAPIVTDFSRVNAGIKGIQDCTKYNQQTRILCYINTLTRHDCNGFEWLSKQSQSDRVNHVQRCLVAISVLKRVSTSPIVTSSTFRKTGTNDPSSMSSIKSGMTTVTSGTVLVQGAADLL